MRRPSFGRRDRLCKVPLALSSFITRITAEGAALDLLDATNASEERAHVTLFGDALQGYEMHCDARVQVQR